MYIRQYPDPCLTVACDPFAQEEIPAAIEIGEQMLRIMHANKRRGIGLAAPQIGINRRLFVLDSDYLKIKHGPILVNPTILWRSDDTDIQEEGCLSLPEKILVDVRRSLHITLCYDTLEREGVMVDLHELAARAVQHEVEHLDGVLILSYMSRQQKRQLERMVEK